MGSPYGSYLKTSQRCQFRDSPTVVSRLDVAMSRPESRLLGPRSLAQQFLPLVDGAARQACRTHRLDLSQMRKRRQRDLQKEAIYAFYFRRQCNGVV